MDKREMDFVLNYNKYLEGGTKEACIKAKDFLKRITTSKDGIISQDSCVTSEEFVEAVKTLIAFSFSQSDNIPQRWYCDNSCCKVSQHVCPGEFNLQKNSTTLCPYYIEEG